MVSRPVSVRVGRRAPARPLLGLLLVTAAACSRPHEPAVAAHAAVTEQAERQVETGALGLVADAVQGEDGELFVLDAGQRQLAVVARGGGIRRTLGRAGTGPGEFVDPIGLAAARGGMLYLLDRGTQRLETYRGGQSGTARTGSALLDFVPEDLCALGERLFILGQRKGYLLHEVSAADGRVLRSLVPDPAEGDPMLSAYYGSGFVQCGPGDQLTLLPLLRPDISRYSATTGRELGRMRIPGYRETRVTRAGGAVVYESPREGAADYAGSLVGLEDGRILVQIGPVPRGARRHEFSSLRSFVLSWRDHTLTELAPALPRIVSVHHDTAVAVHTDPAPGVSLVPTSAFSLPRPGAGRAAAARQEGSAPNR